MPHVRQHLLGPVAILDVRRMNNGYQDEPEDIDKQVALASFDLFARVIATRPPFSVVLTDWLSKMAALGCR